MSNPSTTKEDYVGHEPLNSVQLNAILSKRLPGNFIGVFSSDLLPDVKDLKTFSLILNLSCSHSLGSHWQAWVKTGSGTIHHFCSYGSVPETTEWLQFLTKFSRNGHWVAQRHRIQGEFSPYCGHYCIYYIITRNKTALNVSDFQIMRHVNDTNIVQKLNSLLKDTG